MMMMLAILAVYCSCFLSALSHHCDRDFSVDHGTAIVQTLQSGDWFGYSSRGVPWNVGIW